MKKTDCLISQQNNQQITKNKLEQKEIPDIPIFRLV